MSAINIQDRVKASQGRLTMDKDRADRLEQKIDELTKAVVTLAKVEEKVHGMTRRVGSVEDDCRALYRKIDLLVTEMHTLAIGIKPGLAMSDGFRRTTTTIFVATFAAIAGAVVSFLLLK